MSDVQHYLVTGGEVLEEVLWQVNKRNESFNAAKALAAEVGNVESMALGRYGIKAFQFRKGTKVDRKVWKRNKVYENAWEPKSGDLCERFYRIKTPDNWEFTDSLVGDELHFMKGDSVYAISYRILGGSFVLSVPVDPEMPHWWKPYPDDARLLKKSEYWKLVEDHEEANSKAAPTPGGAR